MYNMGRLEPSTSGNEKRMIHPPMDPAMGVPLPKKGRYQDGNRMAASNVPMSWSQPLRIDTSMDANKLKVCRKPIEVSVVLAGLTGHHLHHC